MRNKTAPFLWILFAITSSVIVISAASWHSVGEIHYLKTFYPKRFTVMEAFYASGVEFIKVMLIGLPLFLVIGAGLYLLRYFKTDAE